MNQPVDERVKLLGSNLRRKLLRSPKIAILKGKYRTKYWVIFDENSLEYFVSDVVILKVNELQVLPPMILTEDNTTLLGVIEDRSNLEYEKVEYVESETNYAIFGRSPQD